MLQVQVGKGQDTDSSEKVQDDLDVWLHDLAKQIESRQENNEASGVPQSGNLAQTIPFNDAGRIIMMQVRDRGQKELSTLMYGFLRQIHGTNGATLTSSPTWEPALADREFDQVKDTLDQDTPALEDYYQLQDELTRELDKGSVLQKQWTALPLSLTEVPQTRTLIAKLFSVIKEAHQEWVLLLREVTEKTWKLKADLISAYVAVVQDAVKGFAAEGQKIASIYQETKQEIDRQIQMSERNDFSTDSRRLQDNFRFWINSLNSILPTSLKFQQQVQEFLGECEGADEDPCCLRKVRGLKDQLDRIQNVLMLHRDTQAHRTLQEKSLSEELNMTSAEWTQTQSQLEAVQQELRALGIHRERLWAEENSVKALDQLESRHADLERKQQTLSEKLAPLRSAMERLRTQNEGVIQSTQQIKAIEQAEEWRTKLDRFQIRCEQESEHWSTGRGLQYRARMMAQEETVRTLQSIYTTTQQKIDGSGVALVRYGLLLLQNLMVTATVTHHSILQKERTAEMSLAHYLQRAVLSHPALAEMLHQQCQSQKAVNRLRQSIEEVQLQHSVSAILSKAAKEVT